MVVVKIVKEGKAVPLGNFDEKDVNNGEFTDKVAGDTISIKDTQYSVEKISIVSPGMTMLTVK